MFQFPHYTNNALLYDITIQRKYYFYHKYSFKRIYPFNKNGNKIEEGRKKKKKGKLCM